MAPLSDTIYVGQVKISIKQPSEVQAMMDIYEKYVG